MKEIKGEEMVREGGKEETKKRKDRKKHQIESIFIHSIY